MSLENTSNNIPGAQMSNYLAGVSKEGNFIGEVGPDNLPEQFAFPFPETLKAIYNLPAKDYQYSKELRQQAEETAYLMASNGAPLEEIKEIINESHQIVDSEKAVGLYLDIDTMKIKLTDAKVGGSFSVEDPRIGFDASNKIMILEIHNHPITSLPSAIDYNPMLIDRGIARFCKGIALLCPDVQIIAVATTNTPKFTDPAEFDKFLQALSQDDVLQKINAEYLAMLNDLEAEMRAFINASTENQSQGDASADIKQMDLILAKIDNIGDENDRVIGSVVKRISLEAIEKLGLVIYTSTDYTHFERKSIDQLREEF